MFTVTWNEPAPKKKYSADDHAFYYDNGCYPDGSYPGGGFSYSGRGDTLAVAMKDLESKITANLSKNVDKQINSRLAAFKKDLGS